MQNKIKCYLSGSITIVELYPNELLGYVIIATLDGVPIFRQMLGKEKVNCEYCNKPCIPHADLANWCNSLCYGKWEYLETLSTDEEYQTWRATYHAN